MALIKSCRGKTPVFGDNCWFAENATIVGEVKMGNDCSVWFNSVIRGDVNSIRIGDKVNVQDGAVIHCTFEKTKVSGGYTENYKKSKSGNPNEFLGKRNDLTPNVLKILAKKFIDNGATIIGGCCETKPSHIKAFSVLK